MSTTGGAAAASASASTSASPPSSTSSSSSSSSAPLPVSSSDATPSSSAPIAYSKRKKVEFGGRVIYEWEQDLEEVNLFITPPPGVTAKLLDIAFTEKHLKVGIKGTDRYYLDEDLGGLILTKESYWTLEDGVIHFQFQKGLLGETWPCCTIGQAAQSKLDPVTLQKDQQQILLERFQREHPGFDFSQANFSGDAPDPRQFMGGIDRTKMQR